MKATILPIEYALLEILYFLDIGSREGLRLVAKIFDHLYIDYFFDQYTPSIRWNRLLIRLTETEVNFQFKLAKGARVPEYFRDIHLHYNLYLVTLDSVSDELQALTSRRTVMGHPKFNLLFKILWSGKGIFTNVFIYVKNDYVGPIEAISTIVLGLREPLSSASGYELRCGYPDLAARQGNEIILNNTVDGLYQLVSALPPISTCFTYMHIASLAPSALAIPSCQLLDNVFSHIQQMGHLLSMYQFEVNLESEAESQRTSSILIFREKIEKLFLSMLHQRTNWKIEIRWNSKTDFRERQSVENTHTKQLLYFKTGIGIDGNHTYFGCCTSE